MHIAEKWETNRLRWRQTQFEFFQNLIFVERRLTLYLYLVWLSTVHPWLALFKTFNHSNVNCSQDKRDIWQGPNHFDITKSIRIEPQFIGWSVWMGFIKALSRKLFWLTERSRFINIFHVQILQILQHILFTLQNAIWFARAVWHAHLNMSHVFTFQHKKLLVFGIWNELIRFY